MLKKVIKSKLLKILIKGLSVFSCSALCEVLNLFFLRIMKIVLNKHVMANKIEKIISGIIYTMERKCKATAMGLYQIKRKVQEVVLN